MTELIRTCGDNKYFGDAINIDRFQRDNTVYTLLFFRVLHRTQSLTRKEQRIMDGIDDFMSDTTDLSLKDISTLEKGMKSMVKEELRRYKLETGI